ncbi:exopolysaccharide biosynthesis operon protein EpsL [Oxalobacteraceae bacterium GrIS 1.11]
MRKPVARTLALLIGAACSLPASAEISDTIHPFVAVTYTRDDNLLRLPDDSPSSEGPRADSIKQVQGGVVFERPIGRQVLSGQAKLSKVTFDHYDELNYNGKDFLAALEWHVGNHVDGHLGSGYTQTITPFTDFHTSDLNLRIQRHNYADAAWNFHPSWRLHASFIEDKYTYDLLSQVLSNRTEQVAELGLDFIETTDSRVGVQVRRLKGVYPNHLSVGTVVIDNGYDQNELKANIYWRFSGVTQFQFLGGLVQRKHNFFTDRDAKGFNGRAIVTWAPLGKVRFTGNVWREFAVVESTLVSSSLNKGESVAAVWDATAKVRVDAQVKRENRDFSSANGISLPGDLSDTTRSTSLGVTYAARLSTQLGVNLTHDVRAGSEAIGTGSYRDNSVSLNASVQF